MQDPGPETSSMWGDTKRLVLMVIGAIAVMALFVGFIAPGLSIGFCAPAAPFGWIITLVSVGVIAGVAWYLLAYAPRHADDTGSFRAVACVSCGRAVLSDWRLCPYCGSVLPKAGVEGGEASSR